MMKKEQYCVATLQDTIVFEGTRSECLDYIHQAIQKGQKVGYLRTTTIAELEAETIRSGDSKKNGGSTMTQYKPPIGVATDTITMRRGDLLAGVLGAADDLTNMAEKIVGGLEYIDSLKVTVEFSPKDYPKIKVQRVGRENSSASGVESVMFSTVAVESMQSMEAYRRDQNEK